MKIAGRNTMTMKKAVKRLAGANPAKAKKVKKMMKKLGKDVTLVEGPRGNIKVTTPEDLYTFRAMIQYRETEQIFGFGTREVPSRLRK